VDAYINMKMKELGISGATLVIVQGDQIAHLKRFGFAHDSGRPVTPETLFFTSSTGKSFAALAILQLVEAGKIKLDAMGWEVQQYQDVQVIRHNGQSQASQQGCPWCPRKNWL
jgi:hypothetical protein